MISKIINGKQILFVKAHANDSFKNQVGDTMYFNQSRWIIAGKANELTEQQWQGIAEQLDRSKLNLRSYQSTPFKNYNSDGHSSFAGDTTWLCWNATESGLSLIASIGMKPETTLIIQKL